MYKRIVSIFVFCLALPLNQAFAQMPSVIRQDGQYELMMMEGRAVVNNRVPAMVLDAIRGIVWTCQNLQDGVPLWVKADLGQNGDKTLTEKKYVGKMLTWQDADLRMPAIVIDTEKGIVWTCQNIIDGKATWVQMDLNSGKEKEIAREEIGIVKTEATPSQASTPDTK